MIWYVFLNSNHFNCREKPAIISSGESAEQSPRRNSDSGSVTAFKNNLGADQSPSSRDIPSTSSHQVAEIKVKEEVLSDKELSFSNGLDTSSFAITSNNPVGMLDDQFNDNGELSSAECSSSIINSFFDSASGSSNHSKGDISNLWPSNNQFSLQQNGDSKPSPSTQRPRRNFTSEKEAVDHQMQLADINDSLLPFNPTNINMLAHLSAGLTGAGGSQAVNSAVTLPSSTDLSMFNMPTKQVPFRCAICAKPFRSKMSLKIHTRIHTGEKPFSCNVCNKQFNQLVNLKKHQLIHTGVKPFACDICHKRFNQSSNLKTHKMIHNHM